MTAVDHFFVHNTDSRNRIAAGQIFDGQAGNALGGNGLGLALQLIALAAQLGIDLCVDLAA